MPLYKQCRPVSADAPIGPQTKSDSENTALGNAAGKGVADLIVTIGQIFGGENPQDKARQGEAAAQQAAQREANAKQKNVFLLVGGLIIGGAILWKLKRG